MQKNIHPKYFEIRAICSCGNIIPTYSTLDQHLNLDVCSACHPFYTGKQRRVNTRGRVERFNKRFSLSIMNSKKKE
ncbi:50S ribosomal protein L31 [Candidatus Palibaumannia cicadellinicola]|uniref:Large ribosomal subunit protein bL31 n=1 Tax=Baumannia cicadellinicola subsp. Homalodisca coagulata TaxID=374463 RepID=RL31_BAUCH|nr:50S ribosomal protein L31 [Candidatus Baumannia cicadellinicola]Q1LTT8.2 RecName: Full=Large ribosomal subunit protein bL31; AltName: Full=50S ribosomal protein L31 [Baumannia cicadellinicola str. Hc (Homalodisca coagulata)]MCJ7462391.1 50S ribosomal protein L31 [Candidatus Baumannia cicadellinicola]MCJ7462851.1 50S ribosomal protein L31 [Candidatus Baumannia cicadellinicola]